MSFDVKKEDRDGRIYFKFNGNIDESSSFPTFNSLKGDVYVDLAEVKSINSVGIRSWIKWFTSFTGVHFIFQSCPKAVVMQMNMVEGFLPDHSSVESIQVPFYCEKCDCEVEKLFFVGKEIIVDETGVKLQYEKESICPDGNDPELDVSETKYFKFLARMNAAKKAA